MPGTARQRRRAADGDTGPVSLLGGNGSMAISDRLFKAGAAPALAVGLAVLAIPILFPRWRPQWAAALKAGAKVFLEAEEGAEGEIIDALAERAIDELADAVANVAPVERDRAAGAVVRAYKARARERAERLGWSDRDRAHRYQRHVDRLHRAAARRIAGSSVHTRQAWEEVRAHLRSAEPEPATGTRPAPIG